MIDRFLLLSIQVDTPIYIVRIKGFMVLIVSIRNRNFNQQNTSSRVGQ